MKLLHVSDLHIGKRVNGFSMLEDQAHVLKQILDIVDTHRPDALLLAGDIYDRTVPAAEAVTLFDDFLTEVAARDLPVCMISGNHDSPERLNFAARILERRKVYIAGVYQGKLTKVCFSDDAGPVQVYFMPFVHPEQLRAFFPDEVIETCQQAVSAVLRREPLETDCRNVLLTHQFVVSPDEAPETCDSETLNVGSLDQVDASLFDGFDYVALGHLHRAQSVRRPSIRYAGSPLKYSFSETTHQKSATLVTLGAKRANAAAELEIELLPLLPLRDMRSIQGPIDRLTDPLVYRETEVSDYIRAVLTDEDEVLDAIGRLRAVYPNLMRLEFDNKRLRQHQAEGEAVRQAEKTPTELFEAFYLMQNNEPMDENKLRFVESVFRCVEEQPE